MLLVALSPKNLSVRMKHINYIQTTDHQQENRLFLFFLLALIYI